ncbi:MAG TPA: hypothetical protein VM100_12605 [Longimicrobiales bacterium]|nr:hypothetical protein [Longimicrobiales bacterium]
MDFRNYSRLPDSPQYWESLAGRIEFTRDSGGRQLRFASIAAFLSTAAAIALLLAAHAPETTDPIARAIITDRAPEITELLTMNGEAR